MQLDSISPSNFRQTSLQTVHEHVILESDERESEKTVLQSESHKAGANAATGAALLDGVLGKGPEDE